MYLDSPVKSQTVASLQAQGTNELNRVSTLTEVTNLDLSMVSTSECTVKRPYLFHACHSRDCHCHEQHSCQVQHKNLVTPESCY